MILDEYPGPADCKECNSEAVWNLSGNLLCDDCFDEVYK